ncbi:sensor histidine kinase [Leifsonia shinshuensis]|uniref:histidine kinase n=1 Tax=Leifsonia shinshuensis TaxID=150026 RepID=A0A853CZ87_9MICO|nr:sensor histidine kinase [Leifsonia shinshuensis]NYJ24110.1 signal transduction histidine kinase [Leifsonia shinshuensis]
MPWNPPADTRPGGPGRAEWRGRGPGGQGPGGWGRGGWGEGQGGPGRRPRGSIWFPVVLSVVLQVPGVFIAAHTAASDPWTLVAVFVAFASSFLLLAGRAYPGPVLVAVAVLCTPAIAITMGPPLAAVPLAFAVVGAVVRSARVWAWWTVAGIAVVGPLGAYLLVGRPEAVIRPLVIALILTLLVGVGEAIRGRRERYREVSRQIAARRESAAEAERLRIARELHDVLAHSLSQISVQAGVGLHLFDSRPDKARESLEAIKSVSSQALEEVRGVLGFLRAEGYPAARAPEPDLARIPVLVETYRRAGLDVHYDDALTSVPSAASQLALYRIVQESLTNIGRHAQARTVGIRLAEDGAEYVLTVADDGRGLPATETDGKGMIGMRERAELLGGRFETRPTEGGGLTVEARIPRRTAEDA